MEIYQINIIFAFFILMLIGVALVSVHYRRKYEELKVRYEDLRSISERILDMLQEQLNHGGEI